LNLLAAPWRLQYAHTYTMQGAHAQTQL